MFFMRSSLCEHRIYCLSVFACTVRHNQPFTCRSLIELARQHWPSKLRYQERSRNGERIKTSYRPSETGLVLSAPSSLFESVHAVSSRAFRLAVAMQLCNEE